MVAGGRSEPVDGWQWFDADGGRIAAFRSSRETGFRPAAVLLCRWAVLLYCIMAWFAIFRVVGIV